MKKLFHFVHRAAIGGGVGSAACIGANRAKTLIVYDGPPNTEFSKLGMAYSIMLKNLMGHFDSNAEMLPVQNYVAGKMQAYDAIFYMGRVLRQPFASGLLAT